jgi:hypothetical protein
MRSVSNIVYINFNAHCFACARQFENIVKQLIWVFFKIFHRLSEYRSKKLSLKYIKYFTCDAKGRKAAA